MYTCTKKPLPKVELNSLRMFTRLPPARNERRESMKTRLHKHRVYIQTGHDDWEMGASRAKRVHKRSSQRHWVKHKTLPTNTTTLCFSLKFLYSSSVRMVFLIHERILLISIVKGRERGLTDGVWRKWMAKSEKGKARKEGGRRMNEINKWGYTKR